jgi:acetyl-CoA synthetase
VKGLRIGKRRARGNELPSSPLELALRPALVDGRWQVPDRFNFTRDVVEALARDPKRRALTLLGRDGVIEPRTFLEISEGAAVWAATLHERSVSPGDRVIVVADGTVDSLEAILGVLKAGGIVVPCAPSVSSALLERIVSSTDAALVVAETVFESTVAKMGFSPDTHYFEVGVRRNSKDVPVDVPTQDTASRDLAFIVSTSGAAGARKDVAHTHGSVFATRVQAEHWLDVGRGDAVWCTSETTSALTMWNTIVGPWSRGAEIVLHHGTFDADERLDLLFRLGPSILCQSPAEYRTLSEHPKLERFRSPRLRRLVSTGDFLDPEVVAVFEERWGMTVYDGYGQAETNIVVADLADGAAKPGTFGRALPGHHVAIIDDQGNELPAGIEGDLAVRGRPPTLFAGYWEQPEETKAAFLGDWYLTGDVAHVDEEGFFTFVGRAEDVITSSGRTFGPFDVERVLMAHAAIAACAVVGIRDLQRGGHFVRAFVVPRARAASSEQLEAELRQYVAEMLPNQQVPREIVFVEELPSVGWKVSRHELRERPPGGRPLWETPTTELDAPPIAAAARAVEPPVAAAAPAVEPPVAAPPPPPAPVEQVAETTWELVFDEPATDIPVAEALPPAAPSPMPEPTPPAPPMREPPPRLESAPVVEVAPEPVGDPVPEPVAEVAPLVPPEPEPEPEPEPQPTPTAEPEPEVAPSVEPEPVAEVAPFVLPEPEPERELEPVAETAPAEEPEPGAEEPATPQLVVLPEPDPEQEAEPAHTPEFSVAAESETLPDYVVEAPETPAPVVVPEPEPEPELGPLPEFVVESEPAAPAPPQAQYEPEEEEEDLGPLPDYVIDPNVPSELRPARPAPAPPPASTELSLKLTVEVASDPNSDDAKPSSTELNFPSVTGFSISGDRSAPDRGERRAPPRRIGAVDDGKSKKRSSEPAEPGDDINEVGWMAGLSNRLSAYSLSEGELEEQDDPASDEKGPSDDDV